MNPISPYWSGRRVVVTGAAGLVGSHLCDLLVEARAEVLAVDDLSKGIREHLSHLDGKIRFEKADLCVPGAAEKLLRGQQVVLHLASRAYGIAYSRNHHDEMLRFNVDLNHKVLQACAASRVERLLVVSSSCVYPDDAPCPTPELPVNTGTPENDQRGYGQAKRQLEIEAAELARETGIGVAIVRPFNAYSGRYKWEGEYSHVIPMLVKRVMDGEEPLVIWGTGRQRRNFLHAVDFCRCFLAVTERHAVADPVNVGYEDTITMAELAGLIGELAGRKPTIRFDPSRPEGRLIKSADSTKLRRVTGGVEPSMSLREGLGEMIEWYHRSFGTPRPTRT